ncbi:STAS/SEC14 domain-containing protein [Mucilaginibacter sp. L3T2-6]|uniref:STAS/SEC14 domain-containing protein n=1 Tax=Mucilaginibacter sp. L3T2-6 TaxID=3062491 RepID=UPI002676D2D6|nr:STAS/SEC14 domain-containing protein [Mucilaginibacter sp. L3T2-6]MDO3643358.1 STAS/SEC14 domain-containing protein [Mucilaginibacter sp. L3T2-6]MDV6215709.1 STAS/SEC14 domain-containing protein [Mucilaginibacter sp. L3T2-6]
MLRYIKDLPDHVVGIHAVGEVSKEDYEKVLIPRLEELVARQGEINYLLVLETDVGNFTAGAWWDDFKLGLKHFTKWNKIAIVTDQKLVEWFSDAFRLFIPGKSRGFSMAELDDAVKWISAIDNEQKKPETPLSDSNELEPEIENTSNKGQGPAGENL